MDASKKRIRIQDLKAEDACRLTPEQLRHVTGGDEWNYRNNPSRYVLPPSLKPAPSEPAATDW